MNKEVWKSISGWDKLYEVSSWGRVRSLDKIVKNGGGSYRKKGKILKSLMFSNGYMFVQLRNRPRLESKLVHRAVAEAFISNPDGKQEVNHKDGNKQNNNVSNLEWVTRSENLIHRHRVLGVLPYGCKPCRCIETGEIFRSIHECSEKKGLWLSQVAAHLKGKKGYGSVKGLHFEYVDKNKHKEL